VTLGIIGAMDVEVELLKAHLERPHTTVVSGMEFCEGALGGVPVVVVRCGVGGTNAAICAQTLVLRFGADRVINTGVAGSLSDDVDLADVVVSNDVAHYDVDVQNLGYRPGEVPGMGVVAFPADARMRDAAAAAVREAAPQAHVFVGRVASGDHFVRTQEEKDRIVRDFGALCCEMEGADIAHTCYVNHVPFVVVRAISDKANGDAAEDYPAFERSSALLCASVVERMVRELA
jgi:adenosylhomocysteine nucleosidase